MKRNIALVALAALALINSGAYADEALQKPTGEQVLFYSTIINAHPATDREKAVRTLDEWMAGKLQAPKMSKAVDDKGAGERAACIAACCGFLGCNPICVAACSGL